MQLLQLVQLVQLIQFIVGENHEDGHVENRGAGGRWYWPGGDGGSHQGPASHSRARWVCPRPQRSSRGRNRDRPDRESPAPGDAVGVRRERGHSFWLGRRSEMGVSPAERATRTRGFAAVAKAFSAL